MGHDSSADFIQTLYYTNPNATDTQLRQHVADQLPENPKETVHLFQTMDDKKSGMLSYDQFRQGLEKANVVLSTQQFQQLTSELDKEKQGYIKYNRLAAFTNA